jgi:hypothetical protein
MASTYLTRTPGSASNRQTWTWSAWIKLGVLGTDRNLFGAYAHSADNLKINIADTDQVSIRFYNNTEYQLGLNRVFRDTSAWYHLVFAVDTTLASGGDRFKIYVNGVRETSFAAANDPTQNLQMTINEATATQIGRFNTGSYFDGSMSHINFIDGTAYDASYFGSTDATTGEWKINTSPSVTYGTNGFFILKDGNSVTDQSGNSNNFTVGGGTLTNTLDCPDNVFATMNPLTSYYAGAWTFSNGNNTVNMGTTSERYVVATMGFSSGKWYWEQKYISESGETATRVGIESNINNTAPDQSTSGYGYRGQPAQKVNNGTYTSWGNTYTAGDIIGVAVDMDNNKIYFSINGVWQESGDPTSGATGTGSAFTIIDPPSGFYFPKIGKEDADTGVWSFNFGNGFFGTSAVADNSTATASTPGTFNYDVPTGYQPLSTKGLNA